MARGGRRYGAGRRVGSKEKSRKVAKREAKLGITPLEVMLKVMRFYDACAEVERAKGEAAVKSILDAHLEAAKLAAKDAAPYMHPRLNAVDHSGNLRVTLEDALRDLERDGEK